MANGALMQELHDIIAQEPKDLNTKHTLLMITRGLVKTLDNDAVAMKERIDASRDRQSLRSSIDGVNEALENIMACIKENKDDIKTNADDITDIKRSSKVTDVILGIGTMIAAALGIAQ